MWDTENLPSVVFFKSPRCFLITEVMVFGVFFEYTYRIYFFSLICLVSVFKQTKQG